jgi:hypothetical protein
MKTAAAILLNPAVAAMTTVVSEILNELVEGGSSLDMPRRVQKSAQAIIGVGLARRMDGFGRAR